MDLLAAED